MSLLEQDHQKGAGVRERYEMYKIYEEGIRKYETRWKVSNTLSQLVSPLSTRQDGRYPTPYLDQSLL